MNEFITIGQIVRGVGIRGELKVKPLTDDVNRYKKLKVVYVKSTPYRMLSCRFDETFVYIKLSGIDDRTQADALRDCYIEIDRVNAVDLEEGTYFIADIVGCKVFTDDSTEIGKVIEVNQFGAADVFTVSDGQKTVRFPFLKKMIVKVDVEAGIIVLKADVFAEVSVYED
ncbi:MAG: 16S rRNA processing protein RimM [Clostridia bacterium]|nr:16S rRNA processing protein RimM [Clostridia bacterium]MBR7141171.1 16S rRNA processing protein RimM [Clostridia bacterium]